MGTEGEGHQNHQEYVPGVGGGHQKRGRWAPGAGGGHQELVEDTEREPKRTEGRPNGHPRGATNVGKGGVPQILFFITKLNKN